MRIICLPSFPPPLGLCRASVRLVYLSILARPFWPAHFGQPILRRLFRGEEFFCILYRIFLF